MPNAAQEIARLQALVKQKDKELAMREAEWRMRDLPPGVGDETGSTTKTGTTFLEPMDTLGLQKVADDLLSRSSAGGAGAGIGEGQHQAEMQPPAAV